MITVARLLRGRCAQRLRPVRARGDVGMTLVELLIAMSVFGVLLSAVMAAVLTTTRAGTHVQNTATTSAQVRKVFQTLDKQVRYADAVNLSGTANGASWVEFRTVPAGGTTSLCVQWRLVSATGALQMRTWTATGSPTASWATLLTSTNGSVNPFTTYPTTVTQTMERLRVNLTASKARGGATALDTTFVARNSTATSPGNADVNGDGVSDAPVCLAGGTLAGIRS